MGAFLLPPTISGQIPAPPSGYTDLYIDSLSRQPALIPSSGNPRYIYQCIPNISSTSQTGNTETQFVIAGGRFKNGTTAPILPNQLVVGSKFRIAIWGTCISTAANVSTWEILYGPTGTIRDNSLFTNSSLVLVAATTGTQIPFRIRTEILVTSVGVSGQAAGFFSLVNTGTGGITNVTSHVYNIIPTPAATLNTTTPGYLSMTCVTSASTTFITVTGAYIEYLK